MRFSSTKRYRPKGIDRDDFKPTANRVDAMLLHGNPLEYAIFIIAS